MQEKGDATYRYVIKNIDIVLKHLHKSSMMFIMPALNLNESRYLCMLLYGCSFVLGRLAALTSELANLLLSSRCSLGDLLLNSDNVLLILAHVGQDEMIVDGGGALADGVEEPDEEDKLEEVVEGDEAEDESSELVDDVEKTEDDPIRQPLLVVIFLLGLESKERHEAGVGDSEEARNVSAADATHNHDDTADDAVAEELLRREAGQLSNLFHDVMDDGVFSKLDFRIYNL